MKLTNDWPWPLIERLLMVANAEHYGKEIDRTRYGSLFDDLIGYGLVVEGDGGGFTLSQRGVKVINSLSKKAMRLLK